MQQYRRVFVLVLAALSVGLMARAAFAAPDITSISPGVRPNTADVRITVTGSDFANDSVVTLTNGARVVTGTNVVNTGGTQLQASFAVTDEAPGYWDLTVSNQAESGDTLSDTCADCFTLTGATPSVTSATPNAIGQGASNVTLSVFGTNLFKGATISFSGAATDITKSAPRWISRTQLDIDVSVSQTAAAGARSITVTNTDGDAHECANCLTINAAPTASSVTPSSRGQGATTQQVDLTGGGFTGTPTVTFSAATGTNGVEVVPGSVNVQSPGLRFAVSVGGDATAGQRTITVRNPDGGVATCSNCFTVNAKPTVSSASPDRRGVGAAATNVVVTGAEFAAGAGVSFGEGVNVGTVTRDSATQLTVNVSVRSDATPGARQVTVTNPDGATPANCTCFTVAAAPVATAKTPVPALGQGAQDRIVAVDGSGFTGSPAVGVSGTGVTATVSSVTSSEVRLEVDVTTAAAVGARTFTLTDTLGGVATCVNCLTINARPSLAASGVSPSSRGQGAANQIITLTGSAFASGAEVTISGNNVIPGDETFVSDTQLTVPITVQSNAATGARDITVTNSDGGVGTCTGCFTVNAAPSVVQPLVPAAAANTTANQLITFNGSGFDPSFPAAGSVKLHRQNYADIVGSNRGRVSANQANARFDLRDAAPGAWSLTLVNGDQGGPVTCSECFTITAAGPSLAAPGVSPASRGQGAQDQTITLTGSGFWPGARVDFSAVGGESGISDVRVTRVSSTQLSVRLDIASNATTGARNVTVTNTDNVATVCASCFTINAAPTTTAVQPSVKMNDGSYTLRITGTGFDNASGSARLTRPGSSEAIQGSSYSFISATEVRATFNIEAATPANWDVAVTNGDGGGPAVCVGCFRIVAEEPTITSVTPSALGQGAIDETVIVEGTRFYNGVTVDLGEGVDVTNTVRQDLTRVRLTVSVEQTATPGPRTLVLSNPDGNSVICTTCFSVTTGPSFSEIAPISPDARGAGAQDQIITITGANFSATPTVGFGAGVDVTDIEPVSATELRATVDVQSDAIGARDVTVVNDDKGRAICAGCFAINSAPGITSLSPSALGQGASSLDIAVEGADFIDVHAAAFSGNGVDVTAIDVVDPGNLTLTVEVDGAAAPGPRTLTVTNGDRGVGSKSNAFTVNAAPAVSAMTPAALGQGATQRPVSISGSNFLAGADVEFAGTDVDASNITRTSATELTAVVTVGPNATPGARALTVTNPDGGTPAVCSDCFTVNAAPAITTLDPSARGQGASGELITVTGSGFLGTPTVTIGGEGVPVENVDRKSTSELEVTIDVATSAEVGARDVTVSNDDHGTPAVCSGCFEVTAAPTLASVAPASAVNTDTVTLTLNGANLGETAAVKLRHSDRPDIAGSGYTRLAPGMAQAVFDLAGAAPGDWNLVLVNGDGGGPATCDACFEITAAPPVVNAAEPGTLRRGASNQMVTVSGANFLEGAQATVQGNDVDVISTTFGSPSELTLEVSVASDAELGHRVINVVNGDGQSSSCSAPGCLEIVAPASATLAYQSSKPLIGALVTATFDDDVSGVSTTNFVLRETDSTNLGGLSVACKDAAGATTSCAGSSVRSATLSTTAVLIPNQSYTARINPAGAAAIIADGAPVATGASTFRAGSGIEQENSPAVNYLWDAVSTSSAHGGSYRRARLARQSASIPVTGRTVTLVGVAGPDMGRADLYVGSTKCTVNFYSSSRRYNISRSCSAPTSGSYVFKVVARGEKGASSGTNTFVAIDALRVDGVTVSTTPAFTYEWQRVSSLAASGGAYAQDTVGGAEVRFKFRGTRLVWDAVFGPSMGRAKVYIDGEFIDSIDFYDARTSFESLEYDCGGSECDEVHDVRIVVSGTKTSASTGTRVLLDRFTVS